MQAKRKKPKTTRIEQQSNRQQPEPITIDVILDGSTHSIEVLRPVAASDAVYVKYEASTLDIVLKFIRSSGFTETPTHNKHNGPKGIWKRGAKQVVAKDDDGKKTYTTAASMEDAVLLAASNDAEAAAEAAAEGEDHEHEDASKDAEGEDHEGEAASNDAEAAAEGEDHEGEDASNDAEGEDHEGKASD